MSENLTHPLLAALTEALTRTAGLLRVPVEGVRVLGVEAAQWPDGCLGLPEDGEACAEAVTPGYLIRLHDGFTWRADEHGNVRRMRRPEPYPDTEVRLHYSVQGGIGGGYTAYETDSWRLSEQEEAELLDLIDAADFFDVDTPMPTHTVYDGITTRLWIARGRRAHEVLRGNGIEVQDTEAFHALMAWAAERTPPMFPRGVMDLDGETAGTP
ncbi:hypothetical protein [Ornithinimicrobium avium]|uniref:Uncharacterized protein n=1 Tax=Ornithinimicrobium avium TaxID=2283195 RepID=A0A345NQC0_9MICO|nr:hypothetical protein [Ornithinimicrobium avium]AXH97228.1 hypothetical protein DV701_14875 [Ornithinimicrobium avium]